MTAPVYLMPELRGQVLVPGLELVLEGPEARHAATVRRTRSGEVLDVCSGDGLRVRCEAVQADRNRLDLRILEVREEGEPFPRRVLVQALAKGGRDEQAVETCTEYGVAAIVAWAANRCVASWKGKETKGRARWEATATTAAKQSRRSWVPEVSDHALGTAELAEQVAEAAARGAQVLVCHEEAKDRLATVVQAHPEGSETWIVVGPEGGIDADELALLVDAGGCPVLLGEHVLRSATAGAYALATLDATRLSARKQTATKKEA